MNGVLSVEHVKQSFVPGQYLYLLLDPLAGCERGDPLHHNVLRGTLGERDAITVMRADLAHTPSVCPLLVTLASPDEPLRYDVLEHSLLCSARDVFYDKRYVCAWFASKHGPETASALIADRCLLSIEGVRRFLPLFEPLRTELLAATSKQDADFWLGLASMWLCPTAAGGLARLHSSSTTQMEPSERARQIQGDVPRVRTVLAAWRHALTLRLAYAPSRWQGETPLPPQAAAEAWRQLRDARGLGLTHLEDQLALALHCLIIHPRINEAPRVRADVARAAANEARLGDLFEAYGDTTWAHIVHNLSNGGN